MAIVDYLREDMRYPPSMEYLAFIAGITFDEFKATAKELQEQGLIDLAGPDGYLSTNIAGLKIAILKATQT